MTVGLTVSRMPHSCCSCKGVGFLANERIGYNQHHHTSGLAKMERIYDILQRIQSLWKELEQTKPDSREHVVLMNQIRALSDEYRALIDVPKKPRESK
jgi:hypothetical protein